MNNEQKQTKRDKAKKIGAYVLIGILTLIFLLSTFGDFFIIGASASDSSLWVRPHMCDGADVSSVATHFNADFVYACPNNDPDEFKFSVDIPIFDSGDVEKYIIVLADFYDPIVTETIYPVTYLFDKFESYNGKMEMDITSANFVVDSYGYIYFEIIPNGAILKNITYDWAYITSIVYGNSASTKYRPMCVLVLTDDDYVRPYATYTERVTVYHESLTNNDIVYTEKINGLGGRQNGSFYTANYADTMFNNTVESRARDIKIKGWCVQDGGVDYYSYTVCYDDNTKYSERAINLFANDFLSSDLKRVADNGGYIDYNHNAHYSFYIKRPYDNSYRNSRVQYIDVVAHFKNGLEAVIFRLADVSFDMYGGLICDCGERYEVKYTFSNHFEHFELFTCSKCKTSQSSSIEHIDNDGNNICEFCGGGIGACRTFSNKQSHPINSKSHNLTRTCIDCNTVEKVEQEHLFNSVKVCTVCDYTELTYKTFDEGYTAGYDEALKNIAYGIFTDVKVEYAIQYNWELGEVWDNHTASKVNVNSSGVQFSQYYSDLCELHNTFISKYTDDDYYDSVRRLKITVTFDDWFVWQERMLTVNFNVPKDDFLESYLESIWVYAPDGTSYEVTTTQTGASTYDIVLDDYFGQVQDVDAPIGQIGFIFYLTEFDDINTILNTMSFGINSSVMVYGANNSYYNQGYADGIAQGEKDYHTAYEKGMSEGMMYGSDEGYDLGFIDGFEKGQNSDNMFTTLFTGIFDSITLAFYSMLNFEILGVNVAMFALSLITLGLIIIVVKKFI